MAEIGIPEVAPLSSDGCVTRLKYIFDDNGKSIPVLLAKFPVKSGTGSHSTIEGESTTASG